MSSGAIDNRSCKHQQNANSRTIIQLSRSGRFLVGCFSLVIHFFFSGFTHSASSEPPGTVDVQTRLVSISDFTFEGAFALPNDNFGISSANYAEGVIEVNGSSMYFVGHKHHDAIAEFIIPALRKSTDISQLEYARKPKQTFTQPLLSATVGNAEGLDQIVGLELYKGQLFGNAVEFYDGPGDNNRSTFVIQNAAAIGTAPVSGIYSLMGGTRAAGWLSQVPLDWQQALGCTHITGHSSGGPIISRHSVGPSAFCIDLDNMISSPPKKTVKTSELLGFKLDQPLMSDLLNEDGSNSLWTHLSQVRFGFIVPGSSTYATFGSSGGHNSGVGYKLARKDGLHCDGYCAAAPEDVYNYYWFWDMRDLLEVKEGKLAASAIRPYASGEFNVPFQTGEYVNEIGGASFDEQTGLLYFSVMKANNTLGLYANPPVIAAYKIR